MRTYVYPWRYMSALFPHNISRRIYVSRGIYIFRTLCGHISPGIYVRTISFFGFQLWLFGRNYCYIFVVKKLIDESSRSLAAYAFSFITCEVILIYLFILSICERYRLLENDPPFQLQKTCPFFSRMRKAKHAKTKLIKKKYI